jgi:hypothetical protein
MSAFSYLFGGVGIVLGLGVGYFVTQGWKWRASEISRRQLLLQAISALLLFATLVTTLGFAGEVFGPILAYVLIRLAGVVLLVYGVMLVIHHCRYRHSTN